MFKACGVKFTVPTEAMGASPQYECLTPLRLLLAKDKDPELWDKEVGAPVLLLRDICARANPSQVHCPSCCRSRCS